jgi:glucose-1-phosphate adenylyltransferase
MNAQEQMKGVLAVILAGGAGERLYPLTRHRAKPAVPFGGIYRLVDFTLSNCLNSGCRRVLVLVQYKFQSLHRHLRYAWNMLSPELGEYVEIVPPQKRVSNDWYRGTADAVFQNLYTIVPENPNQVLVLSGDHIYKMNYARMVEEHIASGADMTVAALQVPRDEASRFGVLEIDRDQRVVGFEEKPAEPKTVPGGRDSLVSMGVYIFQTDLLMRACQDDANRMSSHDFGKDVIPRLIEQCRVHAYLFVDENHKESQYWRDVGTVESYYDATMDLAAVDPQFNLYDAEWPMRTRTPTAPPAKFVFADVGQRYGVASDSIVSPGCIISGGTVRRSVLSPNVRVCSYSDVQDAILFNGVEVGRHARVRNAIVEKNVVIPENETIGYDLEKDRERFFVSERGIVLVERQHAEAPPARQPVLMRNGG